MRFPRGSTLLEILLVVALLLVILGVGNVALASFQRSTARLFGDREIINAITMAARRARTGASGTAWGVYITYNNTTRVATNLTIFSGTSYAARTTSRDIVLPLSNNVIFTSVDFSGSSPNVTNSHEVIFAPLTGATTGYGSIITDWFGITRTIVINSNGIPVRQ